MQSIGVTISKMEISGKATLIPGSNLRSVKLPGTSGRRTSQLGFGCTYFFSAGMDATKSRRMLDAAWDAGIRHFDVARMYAWGRSEALLGQFLSGHPEATVTTKYGLVPHSTARRIAVGIQHRVPVLKKMQLIDPTRRKVGRFDASEARESLAESLRLLRRDHIDLFLLHEPDVADLVHDDLLAFLESAKEEGKIGDYGIGGEYHRIPELYSKRKSYCRVLQFEWSILGPSLQVPDAYRIHYRTFAKPAVTLGKRFEADPALARNWSEITGHDLREPATLSRLLLRAALDAYPDSLVLFSTSREAHIFNNVEVAENENLAYPAARLVALLCEDASNRTN